MNSLVYIAALVVTATAIATAWTALRSRRAVHADTALFFLDLVVLSVILVPRFSEAAFEVRDWPAIIALVGILVEPILLARIRRHFWPVSATATTILGVLFVAATAAQIVPFLSPRVAMFTLLVYLVVGNLYAAAGFIIAAGTRRGPHRFRATIAAIAMAAMGVLFATEILPAPYDTVAREAGILVAALAFPLAFAPPRFLRLALQSIAIRDLCDILRAGSPFRDRGNLYAALVKSAKNETAGQVSVVGRGPDRSPMPAWLVDPPVVGVVYKVANENIPWGAHVCALDMDAWLLVCHGAPVPFPAEVSEILDTMIGITQLEIASLNSLIAVRKELLRSKELQQFKSNFLGEVSHELANPLTPLRLQLSLMKRVQNPTVDASVAVMERNMIRLEHLLNDMADVAHISDARLELHRHAIDIVEIIKESLENYRLSARERGCPFTLSVPEKLPYMADGRRVGQIIDNILSNAIKYSPKGGAIEIDVYEDDGIHIKVQDHGMGMNQEQIGELFVPLARVQGDRAAGIPGTGMGLYIVKGLVELHDGLISVESQGQNLGCTMHVHLPPQ